MFRAKLGEATTAVSTNQTHDFVFKGHRRPVSARLAFRYTKSVPGNSRLTLYPLWKFNGTLISETSILSVTVGSSLANAIRAFVVPRGTTDQFDRPVFPDGIRAVVKVSAGDITYVLEGAFVTK